MFNAFNLTENPNINKLMNLFLDIFLWVVLWEIFDNVFSRYNFSKNKKLAICTILLVVTLTAIYLVNGHLGYASSLYN